MQITFRIPTTEILGLNDNAEFTGIDTLKACTNTID